MSALETALQQFEAAEANLEKLERLWEKISALIPDSPAFGAPPEYDELCMAFRGILPALPAMGGVRVKDLLYDYDNAGQMRLDALEVGEFEAQVSTSNVLEEQGKNLRQYRFLLAAKRRELVRGRMITLMEQVDRILEELMQRAKGAKANEAAPEPNWSRLKEAIQEVETLLGSNSKPLGWSDLMRHLYFGQIGDLEDIHKSDWPEVKAGLRVGIYGENDPIPVGVADLEDIVAARPQGAVTSKLNWGALTDEDFERLIFTLVSETEGYENPQWLQHTNAPDRGRDISVFRIESDPLEGVRRRRVIIQCRNWQSRSVGAGDVSDLRSQMELWQPPRVDDLIIATTGRFTADAIALVEQHNQSDRALHISMWPDSHLERLLAARPHLIAQFRLRQRS
jgi:hypothetical protein